MSGELPWGLVTPLGRPVPEEVDRTTLAGATPFFAYVVEENDLHLTLYFRYREAEAEDERRRLFTAEHSDAVYVALVFEPRPRPDDGAELGRVGWWPDVDSAHAMLEQPLAGRPVIDATRGLRAQRFRAEPTADELSWLEADG